MEFADCDEKRGIRLGSGLYVAPQLGVASAAEDIGSEDSSEAARYQVLDGQLTFL